MPDETKPVSAANAEKGEAAMLRGSEGACECPARKALAKVLAILPAINSAFWAACEEAKVSAPCPCEGLRQEIERLNQALRERSSYPAGCPITGRKFFMTVPHPERGEVATYGGPFDSYTIPEPDEDGHMRSERYDHDAGAWVEGGEPEPFALLTDTEHNQLWEDAHQCASFRAELANERATSESRRDTCLRLSDERAAEWKRAENAEAELAASAERERVLQAEVRRLEIKESLCAKAGLALYGEHEALKERERVLREALVAAREELRLLHMKDTATVYDVTLKARIALALALATPDTKEKP